MCVPALVLLLSGAVASAMLGLPWRTASGGHVRSDVLDGLPGRPGRLAGDLPWRLLAVAILAELLRRAVARAQEAVELKDVTNMLDLPLGPFWTILCLAAALALLVLAGQLGTLLRHREPLPRAAPGSARRASPPGRWPPGPAFTTAERLRVLAGRALGRGPLFGAVLDTVRTRAMLSAVVIGARVLNPLLARTGLPAALGTPLIVPGHVVLGTFLDGLAMLVVALRVCLPAIALVPEFALFLPSRMFG